MKFSHSCAVCLSEIPENSILSLNRKILNLKKIDPQVLSSTLPVLISSHIGCEHSAVLSLIGGELVEVDCSHEGIELELFGSRSSIITDSILGRFQGQNIVLYGIENLTVSAQKRLGFFLEDPSFEDSIDPSQYPKIIGIHIDSEKTLDENLKSSFPVCLRIIPLKERPEDIVFFASLFVGHYNEKKYDERSHRHVNSQTYIALMNYSWPGNIDELRECMKLACEKSKSFFIEPKDLPSKIQFCFSDPFIDPEVNTNQDFSKARNDFVRKYLSDLMILTNGNVTRVAQISKIGRPYLYKKFRELDLKPESFREL